MIDGNNGKISVFMVFIVVDTMKEVENSGT
jgi:hypothetical protein